MAFALIATLSMTLRLVSAPVRPPTQNVAHALAVLFALAFSAVSPGRAAAVSGIEKSPDITVAIAGTTIADEDVAAWETDAALDPVLVRVDLGNLPGTADVDAYTVADNGDVLFSLDVTADLGGVTAGPGDVVRYNGFTFSMELRGGDADVPNGVSVDALGMVDGDLLVSLDTSAAFATFTADDEDLLRYADGEMSLFFDGSGAGVPQELDIDGADVIDETGHLVLSFDTSGSIAGIRFDDEDVLEYTPDSATNKWRKAHDGSRESAAWMAADLDAVFFAPEPHADLLILAALASLLGLRRSRLEAALGCQRIRRAGIRGVAVGAAGGVGRNEPQ